MPSTFPPHEHVSRRRLLAGLGTATAGALAGCSGRVPGTGPAHVDAESTVEDDRIVWRYPPRPDDGAGIGYAAIDVERLDRGGARSPALRLEFNSTIGGIAAGEPYRGYHPDWFRFRIRPPTSYEGRLQYHVRAEPPGQWEGFATYYDLEASVRQFVVELRNVDTQGTIVVPAIFDPGSDSLPDSLTCSVTVQAARPGVLGKTVRVAGQETLELDDDGQTGA